MKFIEKLKFAAVCGIDCETQCAIYQAYKNEDNVLRESLANKFFGDSARWSEIRCDGCKGQQILCWKENCKIKNCAKSKEYEFCIQCEKCPCSKLKQQQMKNGEIILA